MSGVSDPIHFGLWTNWSYGAVYGRTLTVSRADGALIIAFVAFFVAATGSQLWRLICFFLHSAFSTSKPQDALYNQRQAVLRNSASPASGFWELLLLAFAWKSSSSYIRLLPLLLCSALIACALIATSGFSSRVSLGNNVLIAGNNCGMTSNDNVTTQDYLQYTRPHHARLIEAAADYAERCYRDAGNSDCNTLMRGAISFIKDTNASCPFDDSLCLTTDNNIQLDSGLLDSHWDLGINSPPNMRFQYRQTLHCAPLVTEGFRSNVTDSSNRTYTTYMYGPWNLVDARPECNCTLAIPDDIIKPEEKIFIETASTGWKIDGMDALYYNGSLMAEISTFEPIPQFIRTDGHVQLLFLSPNSFAFIQKSSDLWYRATSPMQAKGMSGLNATRPTSETTLWQASEAAWPMGCISQFQVCNPSMPGDDTCTELTSLYDVYPQTERLFGGDPGLFMYWFMTLVGQSTGLLDITKILGVKALTSRLSLIGADLQGPIEQNQWHLDVMNWFSIISASLQQRVVETAAGPHETDPGFENVVARPATKEQNRMCNNQMIRSTNAMSFSVFSLALIFSIGLIIIILSFTIESLAQLVQRSFGLNPYARLEWQATHKLQLQRMAHQEAGFGHWDNGFNDTPVTRFGEKLAILDASEPVPRLVKQRASLTEDYIN